MNIQVKTLLIISFLFFVNCTRKVNLTNEEDKYLLYSLRYKGNTYFSRDELAPYVKQKPNPKLFTFPTSLYVYYFGQRFYDTAKINKKIKKINAKYDLQSQKADSSKLKNIERRRQKKLAKEQDKLVNGNWIMKNLGSAPVVYDSSSTSHSCRELAGFLKTKGCLNALVTSNIDTVFNAIQCTYLINEGKRFKINELKYEAEDGNLKRLINEHFEEISIDTNSYYDEQRLITERDRLEKLFLSNGYFKFNKRYIEYEIDTAMQRMLVKVKIKNDENQDYHKIYRISKVKFKIDQKELLETQDSAYTKEYKGVHFAYGLHKYKPNVLYDKTEFFKGDKFNYGLSQNTQRNISQLDVFKSVNLNYENDSMPNTLIANIETSSASKFQVSDEIGFSVGQGLPGPFGSLTFLSRNVFNGCELFDISLRGGIEGVASQSDNTNYYQSQELSISTGLTIPRIFFLLNFNPRFINYNPRTKFQLSYNFISRPEYQRTNTRLAMTYYLTKGLYNQFSFSLVDVNYILTPFKQVEFTKDLDSLFLKSGNNLKRSFEPSLASNINFGYTFNNFILGQNKNATYFRINAESGGTTLNLLNKKSIDQLKDLAKVQSVFVYWKFNVDFRKYLPVTAKSTFATRFNIGIANPYSGDGALPYEKYFFSGGTNSNRAWLPRRLGPGKFAVYNADGKTNYNFEQPGLLQLEINEEFRFKIYKILDAALFIDAGNIWLLNDDDQRKNISSDFLSQIAIGSGYGVRLDLSFLIVRLDLGYKVYDPSNLNDKWVIKKTNFLNINDVVQKATWNIAVGYPF